MDYKRIHGSIRLLIVAVFCTIFLVVVCSTSVVAAPVADDDRPLFLTPYIEGNTTDEGRKLAQVTGLGWNVTSYSGLLTVNKEYESNMFFWYFPAERKPATVPLLFWLNGLSTASSYALFLQNGPYDLLESSTLKLRNISWQKYYHIVYVDNPVGVGFSFTNSEKGYSTDFDQIVDNLYSTLDQFLQLFPELKSHELYLTGLSLAGKFLIPFASRINEKKTFNMKGVFIGNPLLEPSIQVNYGQYLLDLGFIDSHQKAIVDKKQQEILEDYKKNDNIKVYEHFGNLILKDDSLIVNLTGLNSIYDFNAPYINPYYFFKYISQRDVRKALHVADIEFNQGTKATNIAVNIIVESVAVKMQRLLEEVKILVYVGQMDVVCAYPMLVDVFKSLKWSGKDGYDNAPREKLYADNSDYVWGYLKNYRTFTDVLVRNAGHSAITNQPEHIINLLFNFTNYDRF